MYLDPPGPPQNFRAQAISDTEIQLSWDNHFSISSVVYDICFDVTPACNKETVSVRLDVTSLYGTVDMLCTISCIVCFMISLIMVMVHIIS